MHLRPVGLGKFLVAVSFDAVLRMIDKGCGRILAKVVISCEADLILVDPADQLDEVAFWDWRSQRSDREEERGDSEEIELHLD